ncbi:bacillithiol system redox-active protein YtxJ [Gracilibacillus sp. YIM 98692]|uniref:bacillithiol system redox-active protein YtxJ n=1 Tax=Gracilibacillus sp. YIM 98692 TaxID=2663532 RepID=UPI0013D2303F|nr:bacillithiol system redox-active protein YtxJ [Gracilibacillus sp. YIM 98692]
MEIKTIKDIKEFKELEYTHDSLVVFKHSLTCPISAAANTEFENFSKKVDLPLFRLYVQEARDLSSYLEEKYNVRHESPQALKIEEGAVVWHASHGAITEDSLNENV